jgi:hypothetical protein
MRTRILCIAALSLSVTPVFAQVPKDVQGPLKLTPSMVMCTDVPATAKPEPHMFIAGPVSTDGRTSAAAGMVVIKRTPDDGMAIGNRYVAQRIHGDLKAFPRPGEGFGDIRITGTVIVRAIDDVNAIAEIDFACDSVESGDYLEPFVETVIPTAAAPMIAPDFSDRANLLFGADNRVMFGDGDILSIDRGTIHGVVPGARYAIYRDPRDGMPLVHIGEIVVLTTSELTSKAIVTKAFDAMYGDVVAVPRRTP